MKDISWIENTATHQMEIMDKIWEDRHDRIIHPGHIYWMINAIKELAKTVQELQENQITGAGKEIDHIAGADKPQI